MESEKIWQCLLLFIVAIAFSVIDINADRLPTCKPKDFHFEYTECDSIGGRWRVSVLKPNTCVGGAPNSPVRGKDCKFTCPKGHYLDINGDQKCQSCPAGTYSLGGGVRFDNFDHMPAGFIVTSHEFLRGLSSSASKTSSPANCTRESLTLTYRELCNLHIDTMHLHPDLDVKLLRGVLIGAASFKRGRSVSGSPKSQFKILRSWVVSQGSLASFASGYRHSLTYSANLVRAGILVFSYQLNNRDIVFHFSVRNDQCQVYTNTSSSQWLNTTEKGEWRSVTVTLKSGVNILKWETLGTSSSHGKLANASPVLIRSIEITGIAYTSECTRCRPGSFSIAGSFMCRQCPKNTYSGPGAAACTKCNTTTQYSAAGSVNCTERRACTSNDFFEYNTPCDAQQKIPSIGAPSLIFISPESMLEEPWVTLIPELFKPPQLCLLCYDEAHCISTGGHDLALMEWVREVNSDEDTGLFVSIKNDDLIMNRFYNMQKMFSWIKPKMCREDLPGAVKLPAPRKKQPCPPCNPGMTFKNGSCVFCERNSFSADGAVCIPCPVTTAPNYEINYKWWSVLPPNVTVSCLSIHERGCVTKGGWQPNGDHISTGKGHSNDVFLLLLLRVGGFRGNGNGNGDNILAVGKLSFVFELDCDGTCKLIFMKQAGHHGVFVITSWTGRQAKQEYVHELKSTEEVWFQWAFQKEKWEDSAGESSSVFTLTNDQAKIYSIHVTNTLAGGAPSCTKCPKGTSHDGCIPCPTGHYIDPNTTQCVECPINTVLHDTNAWGVESCYPCWEGLKAVDHKYCTSDCHFHSPEGKHYDFSELRGVRTVQGSRLFMSSGIQYYHLFNISLCGGDNSETKPMCVNNITAEALGSFDYIHALICRSTIVPPVGDLFNGKVISAQPVSLADSLLRVTSDSNRLNMSQRMTEEGFDVDDDNLDVHFLYNSNVPTEACPKGRNTIITLRCDISEKGVGSIDVPPKCTDGTCDGCNFHFLWRSHQACPACKKEEYRMVEGDCQDGERTIHYFPPKHCVLLETSSSLMKKLKCTDLRFWLTVAGIVVGFFGTLMCALLCYCHKKNQKLEYKYSRLIENSAGKDGELPSAETCALDANEEDEFDSVDFNESRRNKFFKKFKKVGKKDDNLFETMQLTEKTLDL